MSELPGGVLVLWWTALIVTVLFVVPVTLRFLHRTWLAARTIRRHTADTRVAAQAIQRKLAGIAALDAAAAAARRGRAQ
jgi:Na+/glutamate symporter